MTKTGYTPSREVRQQLAPLMETNVQKSIRAFIEEWVMIAGAAVISLTSFIALGNSSPLSLAIYGASILVIGSRQRALECLIHEATHFNLSRKNHKLNDSLTWLLAALPLGHNLLTERKSHCVGHHQNFWNPDKDPDFKRYLSMGLEKLPASSVNGLAKTVAQALPIYMVGAIKFFIVPAGETAKTRFYRGLYWTAILALAFYLHALIFLLLYWFVPFFVVLTVIRFIGELSEHAALGCDSEFAATRNNLGFINESVVHPRGDAFHIVHHLFPNIPFYNMPQAHAILMTDPNYATMGEHAHGLVFNDGSNKTTIKSLIEA